MPIRRLWHETAGYKKKPKSNGWNIYWQLNLLRSAPVHVLNLIDIFANMYVNAISQSNCISRKKTRKLHLKRAQQWRDKCNCTTTRLNKFLNYDCHSLLDSASITPHRLCFEKVIFRGKMLKNKNEGKSATTLQYWRFL